jgi:hypothetical protein
MMLNVASARVLREGDDVRLLSGPHRHKLAKVVGADPLSERSIVVQYRTESGYRREQLSPNAVSLAFRLPEKEELEPLPSLSTILAEGSLTSSYLTCGVMSCVTLQESGTVLTFVPRDVTDNASRLFKEAYNETRNLSETVRRVLTKCFLTRRPHLVHAVCSSCVIDRALHENEEPQTVVDQLL